VKGGSIEGGKGEKLMLVDGAGRKRIWETYLGKLGNVIEEDGVKPFANRRIIRWTQRFLTKLREGEASDASSCPRYH